MRTPGLHFFKLFTSFKVCSKKRKTHCSPMHSKDCIIEVYPDKSTPRFRFFIISTLPSFSKISDFFSPHDFLYLLFPETVEKPKKKRSELFFQKNMGGIDLPEQFLNLIFFLYLHPARDCSGLFARDSLL